MAISSSPFGSVTLTGDDAVKFNRQVTYGRPKAAAVSALSRGVAMAKEYAQSGSLTITAPKRKKPPPPFSESGG